MRLARRFAALFAVALVVPACGETAAPTTTVPAAPLSSTTSATTTLPSREGCPEAESAVEQVAAGFNTAGYALWRAQPVEANLVFSPVSIGHALLMARAAADEPTGAAIDAALCLPPGQAAHEAWSTIDRAVAAAADAEDEITVIMADRIWPDLTASPDPAWVELLDTAHRVSVENLDLQGDGEGSRQVINSWVDEQTQGLIPELLPEGFITPATVLVLTDALYFKARWQLPFGKYSPVTDVFTRLDGSAVEVEFLVEMELGSPRGEGEGFVGAEIPYVGGEFSMLLIVPDEGRFADVRDRLDQALLEEIDATFTTGPYELFMPRWDDNSTLDLLGWLSDIGAAPGYYPAIDPEAFLGAAVHAADIAVDEWGTVAAAATGLGFLESGPPPPEMTIRADRPFLYLIRHRPTGLVLFAGQVTDPTA